MADVLFWVTVVACIVAQVALLRSASRTPSAPTPEHPLTAPSRASEIAWAVLPAVLLAVVLVLTWREMHRTRGEAAPPTASTSLIAS